jgi:acyl-coenzyme A synthetase/AMP-(fatty) acid ligase
MQALANTIRGFYNNGLKPGDVVAAIGGNATTIWSLLNATASLGLVLAVVNESWSTQHLKHLLSKLGPQLVVGYGGGPPHRAHSEFVQFWMGEDGSLERNVGYANGGRPARVASLLAERLEGAVIFSTSGSTGEPKCVVSTSKNRAFCTSTIGTYLELRDGQCIVNALPPSFDYGFYQGLLAQEFALKLELVASAQMTGEVLERIRRQRRIVLPLTPALAARLCRAIRPDENFTEVEIVSLTGGGTSFGLRQRLAAAFPRARIFAMYGLTECKRVAYLDPALFLEKTNSCGREMNGVTADIVDAAEKPVPPGGIGELTVSGENVCAGYWADPVATQRRFRVGPEGKRILFTGDYFRRDKDGYLEFIGRADELVKVRDELVSLGTIETELRRSKLVLDLTLRMEVDDLGIPLLSALVVPEGPWLTESEILKSFRQYISRPGHLPHKVLLLNELPVNGHGKHDKMRNLDHIAESTAI